MRLIFNFPNFNGSQSRFRYPSHSYETGWFITYYECLS